MSSPESIRLADGRRLCYARFGDPQGRPLFYFHGFPGSRLEAVLAADSAALHGVRLISVDRPGYGGSDFRRGRSLCDWPDDVAELATALGYERFGVVGASGGGPYAAACAWKLAGRLTGAGILCGLGPLDGANGAAGMSSINRFGLALSRKTPWLVLPVFGLIGTGVRIRPKLLLTHAAAVSGPADRAVIADPRCNAVFQASFREAFRQGVRGPSWDLVLYGRPWGFALEEIRVPVHLWHGEDDVIVPAAMGRAQAARIPGCIPRFVPGEGHFSLILRCMERMFAALDGAAGPDPNSR